MRSCAATHYCTQSCQSPRQNSWWTATKYAAIFCCAINTCVMIYDCEAWSCKYRLNVKWFSLFSININFCFISYNAYLIVDQHAHADWFRSGDPGELRRSDHPLQWHCRIHVHLGWCEHILFSHVDSHPSFRSSNLYHIVGGFYQKIARIRQVPPQKVVDMLGKLYSLFDKLTERHKVAIYDPRCSRHYHISSRNWWFPLSGVQSGNDWGCVHGCCWTTWAPEGPRRGHCTVRSRHAQRSCTCLLRWLALFQKLIGQACIPQRFDALLFLHKVVSMFSATMRRTMWPRFVFRSALQWTTSPSKSESGCIRLSIWSHTGCFKHVNHLVAAVVLWWRVWLESNGHASVCSETQLTWPAGWSLTRWWEFVWSFSLENEEWV